MSTIDQPLRDEKPRWPEPSDRSEASRNAVILAYYPLVRTIAYRIAKRIPSSQDVEELVNIGVLGLIDATERFDPARGVPFKSYAEIRIQGAMVDALRASDWVPRSVRRKATLIEASHERLRRRLGREPSREDLAADLGMDPREFDRLRQDAATRKLVSSALPVGPDSNATIEDQVAGTDPDIEDLWVEFEVRQEVLDAIRLLPKKQRAAVAMYYVRGLTLKEIGMNLGVTESRACQLRGEGVKQLRRKLKIELPEPR
ncbi:MAG: FliA/WhiG family RNA polymerase sigma factor [Pseudomonadota bacterium]